MVYKISRTYYHSLLNELSGKYTRATDKDVVAYLNKVAGILHGVKSVIVY